MSKQEKRPNVDGITEVDFQQWQHDPITKMFMKYLREYSGALRESVLAQWETGALQLVTEQEAKGRIKTLTEVADLTFAPILVFYGVATEQEEPKEDAR